MRLAIAALIIFALLLGLVRLIRWRVGHFNPANNPRDEGADCEPVHVAFKRGKGRG